MLLEKGVDMGNYEEEREAQEVVEVHIINREGGGEMHDLLPLLKGALYSYYFRSENLILSSPHPSNPGYYDGLCVWHVLSFLHFIKWSQSAKWVSVR